MYSQCTDVVYNGLMLGSIHLLDMCSLAAVTCTVFSFKFHIIYYVLSTYIQSPFQCSQ